MLRMVGIGRACGLLVRRRELAINIRVLARGNQGKERIDKSKLDKWGRITPEFKDPYEAHFYKIHGQGFIYLNYYSLNVLLEQ